MDTLADYDYDIQYIEGSHNVVADALSRPPDTLNLDSLEATEELELDETVTEVVVVPELKDKLTSGLATDPVFGCVYRVLAQEEECPQEIKHYIKHFKLDDGLLYYAAIIGDDFIRVCVPDNPE
ncbi:unnamed protein product [Ambrosiozyma monospora]|uniref:Unnamed protein product n=1 Tax=Ambrosiozyma monospora TaxID=43982 RepID=A0ACB5T4L9_AMBMO|nr:unnamed protein product [Ambrosiozyma monospora]